MRVSTRKDVAGMTLTEVLVAMVVFSVGLLGLASLQFTGSRHGSNSKLRALAMTQAQTMADQMRANAAGVSAGAYSTKDAIPAASKTVTNCASASEDCDELELADFHLKRWLHGGDANNDTDGLGLDNLLPSGQGSVCLDQTPETWACDGLGEIYTIKVRWTERNIDSSDDPDNDGDGVHLQTVTLLTQPLG